VMRLAPLLGTLTPTKPSPPRSSEIVQTVPMHRTNHALPKMLAPVVPDDQQRCDQQH
jgi:hypothetical protein